MSPSHGSPQYKCYVRRDGAYISPKHSSSCSRAPVISLKCHFGVFAGGNNERLEKSTRRTRVHCVVREVKMRHLRVSKHIMSSCVGWHRKVLLCTGIGKCGNRFGSVNLHVIITCYQLLDVSVN